MSTKAKEFAKVPAISELGPDDTIAVVTADGVKQMPVSALLGAIRIGGRNLVRGSGEEKDSASYAIGSYTLSEALRVGEKLLVTIWGELGDDRDNFTVYVGYGDTNRGICSFAKKDFKDGKCTAVLEPLSAMNVITLFQLPSAGTSSSTVHRIKVERGNVPTDWTPAPEDASTA